MEINTREQYEAIKLGAEVETPWGVLKVVGKSYAGELDGDRYGVSFAASAAGEYVGYFSNKHGWETANEQKCRVWDAGLLNLTKDELALVNAYFADRVTSDTRHTLKAPGELAKIAIRRIVKEKGLELETCSRCYGSGEYSYNQIDGRVCYGCGGSGKKLPKAKEALRAFRCE